ncbi:MAG: hypothetical protein LBE34_00405 [Flavobacteriaceae bacterium]|nr:hypothetical protein [Flavobacteriaceae bacterium]
MKKNKCKRGLLVILLLIGIGNSSYGQIAIGGDKLPNFNTDLTLGSDNKGVLLNRVKLVNANSASPLDANSIVPGMLVYNTNVVDELKEGFYFWTSAGKWSRMYVKTTPTREMNMVYFKETSKQYNLPYSPSNVNPPKVVAIDELNVDYVADVSGQVFIELTMYAAFQDKTAIKAGNTFCYTTVTEGGSKNETFKGITAISPYNVLDNEGLMPTQGYSNFVFNVEKGKTYAIRTTANETYAGAGWTVLAGDYVVNNLKLHSSIKVTFLSEPKL